MKRRREQIANYSNDRPATRLHSLDGVVFRDFGHSALTHCMPIATELYQYRPATPDTNGSIYEQWKKVISSNGPYSYLWTLAFIHPYSDEAAIRGLSQWSRFANRKVFGPRWQKNGNGIEGLVVAERHNTSKSFRGRLHFHLLLNKSDVLDHPEVESKLKVSALRLKDDSGRQMTDVNRIDLVPITDEAGIIDYLVKDLRTWEWDAGDNIMFLDHDGIEGVALPLTGSSELMRRH